MQFQYLATLLALTGAALSAPTATRTQSKCQPTQTLLSAQTVVDIMPKSSSCDGRGDECRTAAQAFNYLGNAMIKYNTTKPMEQAGILALVALESGQMQYKKNLDATEAAGGKGTSNQQSGDFNVQYANTFKELKAKSPTTSTVLDMVTDDQYNFGTGPWYYATHPECAAARGATSGPADDWFTAYMACVGVDMTDEEQQKNRLPWWEAAKKALSVA